MESSGLTPLEGHNPNMEQGRCTLLVGVNVVTRVCGSRLGENSL